MIDFTYLAKFIYVSIGVLKRFTMEDRKHAHNMRFEDGPGIVTNAFPCISLIVPRDFYWFYGGRCLGSVGGLRGSFKEIYV